MRIPLLLCVLLGAVSACAKKKTGPTPTFTTTYATVNGTLRNLFSPTHAPFAASDCATPLALEVRIYDVGAFVLHPDLATPLTKCPVAADGTFSCSGLDVSQDSAALLGLYDDADNAASDCISASATILLPCSSSDLADKANTACGAGHTLDDAIIGDNETIGAYAVAQAVVAALDTQAQMASNEATFAPLAHTGAVLNAVFGNTGLPFAGALPYLPKSCADKLQCRSFFLAAGDTPALDLSATATTAAGMWLAQIVTHDTSGKVGTVDGDISTLEEPDQQYGSVDCNSADAAAAGGTEQCFTFGAAKPIALGERGKDLPAVVFINLLSSVAAADGHCPLYNSLIEAQIDPAVLACPAAH